MFQGEEEEYSDDDFGDGGMKAKEPNQFDGLCDGVLNSVSLIHAAVADVRLVQLISFR